MNLKEYNNNFFENEINLIKSHLTIPKLFLIKEDKFNTVTVYKDKKTTLNVIKHKSLCTLHTHSSTIPGYEYTLYYSMINQLLTFQKIEYNNYEITTFYDYISNNILLRIIDKKDIKSDFYIKGPLMILKNNKLELLDSFLKEMPFKSNIIDINTLIHLTYSLYQNVNPLLNAIYYFLEKSNAKHIICIEQ